MNAGGRIANLGLDAASERNRGMGHPEPSINIDLIG